MSRCVFFLGNGRKTLDVIQPLASRLRTSYIPSCRNSLLFVSTSGVAQHRDNPCFILFPFNANPQLPTCTVLVLWWGSGWNCGIFLAVTQWWFEFFAWEKETGNSFCNRTKDKITTSPSSPPVCVLNLNLLNQVKECVKVSPYISKLL